jgi:broad specificity phosphatase PhoE
MALKRRDSVYPVVVARVVVLHLALVLVALTPVAPVRGEDADFWQKLRASELFAIMRHAIAPGTGDPAEFNIEDCSTQRNVSEEGRRQAERAGDLFRKNGVRGAAVYSSQWCRCRETARLLGLGPVSELMALNSFFGQYERRPIQTQDLKEWLSAMRSDRPYVLVTHQVNISALLGRGARSGEIIFVRQAGDGKFEIAGSIVP